LADGAQGVGYLLKEKWAICACSPMRCAASPRASRRSTPTWSRGWWAANGNPLDKLTPRERQVLAQIAEGRSNAGIARELTVTVAAVERHVTSIFDKLGLHQSPDQHHRVLAVLTYLRA